MREGVKDTPGPRWQWAGHGNRLRSDKNVAADLPALTMQTFPGPVTCWATCGHTKREVGLTCEKLSY